MPKESKNTLGAVLATDDGSLTLVHPDHSEAYHSRLGATAEARLLYVEASGILADFAAARPVRVLDVGLGLAYNAVQTIAAWALAATPGSLSIQSLEINSDLVAALSSGNAAWQENWPDAQKSWCRALSPHSLSATIPHPTHAPAACTWRISLGDALSCPLAGPFNYIWQDPFSPEKNPSMWSPAWFASVRVAAHPDAKLMTYSVARAVRDALTAAAWTATRFPAAAGHKKQWLRATPALKLSVQSAQSFPAAFSD